MPDRKDPDEVLDEQAERPLNRGLRVVGESAFGALIALVGTLVVAWGVLVTDQSVGVGAVIALVGLVVVVGGILVARG